MRKEFTGSRNLGVEKKHGGYLQFLEIWGTVVPSCTFLFQVSEGEARELAISACRKATYDSACGIQETTIKPFFLKITADNEAISQKFGFFLKITFA